MVASNVLQYEQSKSEYVTIIIGAVGLPKIWSEESTGRTSEGLPLPELVEGAFRGTDKYTARATITPPKSMAMGIVREVVIG